MNGDRPGPASAGTTATREGLPALGEVVVADIMSTPVVVVRADSRLGPAVRTFVRTGLRHLVVVDSTGVSVGVLGHDELVSAWFDSSDRRPRTVAGLPLSTRASVTPATAVVQAAMLMAVEHLDVLPVVGRRGEVLGVLSATDLVRLVARHGAAGAAGQSQGQRTPSSRPVTSTGSSTRT